MANYVDIKYNFTIGSGATTGAMILIKTLTASSSGTLSFVNGSSDVVLNNTYPLYKFEFIIWHFNDYVTIYLRYVSGDKTCRILVCWNKQLLTQML